MISYAQNYEDVLLSRALGSVERGFYIDVGAADPTIDSVTRSFYDRGWSGINIEPVEQLFRLIEEERPNDINLQCLVGDQAGNTEFFVVRDTGLSTANADIAAPIIAAHRHSVNETEKPVLTLEDICSKYCSSPIHFLKIDVEGWEQRVLKGMDFEKFRPWVVVVEALCPQSLRTNHDLWESLLTDKDYEFVYFDGLNRFYLSKEKVELREHFDLPVNCFDSFIVSNNRPNVGVRPIQQIVSNSQAGDEQWLKMEDTLRLANREINYLESQIKLEQTTKETLISLEDKLEKILADSIDASARVQLENDKLSDEIEKLRAELAHNSVQIARKQTDIDRLSSALNKANTDLQVALESAKKDQEDNRSLKVRCDEYSANVESLNSELVAKTAQFSTVCKDYEILESQHRRVSKQREHWEQAAGSLDQRVKDLESSLSWKLTRPLRNIVDVFQSMINIVIKTPIAEAADSTNSSTQMSVSETESIGATERAAISRRVNFDDEGTEQENGWLLEDDSVVGHLGMTDVSLDTYYRIRSRIATR